MKEINCLLVKSNSDFFL